MNTKARAKEREKENTKDGSAQKGKSKGKQKGKDSKGKGKSYYDQKGAKGNSSEKPKGKGKGEPKSCYNCGPPGHLARDCWQSSQVRNVTSESMPGSTVVQGSPTSSGGAMPNASNFQHETQQLPANQVFKPRGTKFQEFRRSMKML